MDKIQKIKEWISKEQEGLMDAQGNFEYPEHEEAYHILCNLDSYIDSMQEEPVSEDLEEEIAMWMKEHFDRDMSRYSGCYLTNNSLLEYARHFANWQKQQDQSVIELAEDHAILAGMEKMKEQLMAKAVDAVVKVDAGGYPYIDRTIELYDYDKDIPLAKRGDKVKILVIKED